MLSGEGSDYCSLISDGAIAQLGERLLCKQEVVGSIPSGSTRLRAAEVARHSLKAKAGAACSQSACSQGLAQKTLAQKALAQKALAQKALAQKALAQKARSSRNVDPRARDYIAEACALSDIVKRRSTQFRDRRSGIRDQKNSGTR